MADANIYAEAFRNGLKPIPKIPIWKWAEDNRIMTTRSSKKPGPWRNDVIPYGIEIMDEFSPHSKTEEIVWIKSSQIGGTECVLNVIGYYMDYVPCPILYMISTDELANDVSTDRVEPMIDGVPTLKKKIGDKRKRDTQNTIHKKGFPGGCLFLMGAKSANKLRNKSVRVLMMDEVSSFETTKEGDTVELARKRTQAFQNKKKIGYVSTPTFYGTCQITRQFEQSDKRYYQVPCPHCEHYQKLEFKNLRWNMDRENKFKKPDDVCYECKNCGCLIEEYNKQEMLEKGKWIKENPSSEIAGFHLNSLYSPIDMKRWSEIAIEYEQALKNESMMQVFVNTILGEAYRSGGKETDWETLYNRRENYQRNKIPKGGLFITCGVDVQHDRLECELVVWGREKQSWSLDYRVFYGVTKEKDVWSNLDNLLREEFEIEGANKKVLLKNMAIDSSDGTMTAHVYDFCRKYNISRVFPIKGRKQMDTYFTLSAPKEFKVNGRKIPKGIKLYSIGVNLLKSELMGFLELKKDSAKTPYGYCHFPDYNEEYFLQLTSEVFLDGDWVKTRARNEALDCRIYARAAAAILGIDRYTEKDWKTLENNIAPVKTYETENEIKQEKIENKIPPEKPKKERKRCDYWDNWR